ncbi:MAG TPA: helix-turn-helix transcriptional regulator, partial [Petrimonas sp.]|nr:helix-turn-helix transcriptional regulator [Petrimonas sp.]
YKFIVHKNIDLMKKERELGDAVRKLGEAKQELELLKSRQEVSEAPVPEGASDDKTRPALSGDERKNLLLKLHEALVNDKLYTKADLTVEKLAKKLSTNRTYLSQLINEEFQKGYSDLINEYRIREAMSLLSDPVSGQRYSIDAIARESGFNNISNFNMLFRKHVGTTPSVFRKNAHSQ